jgi:hypothetical protein
MSIKDRFLDAFTNLHERAVNFPQWGLTGALLREFTARERQYANDAVQAQDEASPDQILYRAMLLQRCLTDPATGTPFSDGRRDPTTGEPAIDPRTRAPIFTIADVEQLADGRFVLFNALWDELLEVAAMGPRSLFRGDPATDGAERGQGKSPKRVRQATDGDASQGSGDADGGGAPAGDAGEGHGAGGE